jgi:N6-adenosine-specific RNA methylase IME4
VKYGVIYVDPPWTFATYSNKGKGRSAEAHYDCMSLDDIKALPVENLAADNCVLLMWITDPMLEKGFEVIRSWGFTYKTVGFYWVKHSVELESKERHYPIGTGYWTRANPEQCLLASRGKPSAKAHDVRKLLMAPRREHSRKPDEMYDCIERLCEGPYVELFARYPRSGWDTAFSTLEGAVDRRWKSNEGKPSLGVSDEPIDILSVLDEKPIDILSHLDADAS